MGFVNCYQLYMTIKVHGLDWRAYKTHKWTSNFTSISPQTLWNLSTFTLEELIHNISVRTWTEENFYVLIVQNNVKSMKGMQVKVQRSAPDGQCYTLQIDSDMQVAQVMIRWLVYLSMYLSFWGGQQSVII